ncbi:hypothetical protein [Hydrogenovibrio marinus]|uniref:DNA methylase N-4/N-6 domain-containing protein n=1 Tax=Hydrogenovibrio marinus TaxID=28885 RepID=A0A066ZLF4_HYDMR|nr:hypothetical protein [Hydrogenovibrio marinus]KDN94638.1 hypothetical protein EI16_12110 [Hydrogenovibrio marinus]
MQSIVSYPDRGHWGDSKYRGNHSGHLMVDLINQFKPGLVCDANEGSGTNRDVCSEMGVDYVGLDLMNGQDFTKDYILDFLPRQADLVWTHPPYADMIRYSGAVWGDSPVEGDTSLCSIDEFVTKSQIMLMNQREATRNGGHYVTLIGDLRRKGSYYSFQADFQKMMPKNELAGIVIKAQHNTLSGRNSYSGNFIPIAHEYLLIWKKKEQSFYQIAWTKALELKHEIASTWRNAIRMAMMKLGGQASLTDIYTEIEQIAGNLIAANQHWKARIRNILQKHYENVERGVWTVAA